MNFINSIGNTVKSGLARCHLSVTIALMASALLPSNVQAQSTFGSIVGNVHDPSGAVVPTCMITIVNKGTSARRSTLTDDNGGYSVSNLDAGAYQVVMEAPGFQRATYDDIVLLARQVARIDGSISLATQAETVNVSVAAEAVINTEVSSIAETKTGRELIDLPVGIASRAAGSTSPISTLTTQPGVQTDASGGISVAGAKPSMLSVSIDGISSTGPRSPGPLAELFPSMNAIAEIRISETNNSAEFSGISDITTISKSGTNSFHGGVFENLQNTATQARNPFSATVPKLNLNNYGAYIGGPVRIPKLYNGRDRTFFFFSYEGLKLPKETVLVESVPSLGLREGDLSSYLPKTFNAPGSGTPYPNNRIPISQISPLSLNVLQYLFPLPNVVSTNPNANNYVTNFPTPINSQQGDMRIDQTINSKQAVYARFTYKNKAVTTAPSGSILVGGISQPELDKGLTVAYNYVVTPRVINELRTGFNGNSTRTSHGMSSAVIAGELGLTGLPQELPKSNVSPTFTITGFQGTGQATSRSLNNTFQVLDSVTWSRGSHTVKFGGDYRRLTGYYSDSKLSNRLGGYTFNGGVTSLGTNGKTASTSNPAFIGNPFAAFLLGIPDKTSVSTVIEPDTDAYGNSYGLYLQDDWKVTPRLTMNIGLRWEYHPMFSDHLVNTASFLPDYKSFVNGVLVNGAVIIPNERAFKILNPIFAESIYPTPILAAKDAGIPETLRFSKKTSFAPRFGFAWRPFANGKTVLRGGYGIYTEGLLGSLTSAAWSIASCFLGNYNQIIENGAATLVFPHPFPANIAQPGVESFNSSIDPRYTDPYVHQWNLTLERDIGFGTALRASYTGSHASHLGIGINYNQLPANTVGYDIATKSVPFPLWSSLPSSINGAWANYDSITMSVNKRMTTGLQFQSSYAFSKNLTNGAGLAPTAYASENGGKVTDRYNVGLDYGNESYTRRHRFLTTFLYELPFGRGKLLGKGVNGVVDRIIGGWQLSGVLLFQSGPFMTVTTPSGDPAGIGFPLLYGDARPDIVYGAAIYPDQKTTGKWVNSSAFAVPQNNIGRFGNAAVGNIVGPGTQAVATSLIKSVTLTESKRLQFGAQAANLFNHPNYAPPNLSLTTAAFGTITNLQTVEGAGPRALQLTARIIF